MVKKRCNGKRAGTGEGVEAGRSDEPWQSESCHKGGVPRVQARVNPLIDVRYGAAQRATRENARRGKTLRQVGSVHRVVTPSSRSAPAAFDIKTLEVGPCTRQPAPKVRLVSERV